MFSKIFFGGGPPSPPPTSYISGFPRPPPPKDCAGGPEGGHGGAYPQKIWNGNPTICYIIGFALGDLRWIEIEEGVIDKKISEFVKNHNFDWVPLLIWFIWTLLSSFQEHYCMCSPFTCNRKKICTHNSLILPNIYRLFTESVHIKDRHA